MARRKKTRRRTQKKIPFAVTAGLAGTLLGGTTPGQMTLDHIQKSEWANALIRVVANVTGYHMHQGWNAKFFNLMPLIAGAGVSIGASKLGVNRRLSAIPYIKL